MKCRVWLKIAQRVVDHLSCMRQDKIVFMMHCETLRFLSLSGILPVLITWLFKTAVKCCINQSTITRADMHRLQVILLISTVNLSFISCNNCDTFTLASCIDDEYSIQELPVFSLSINIQSFHFLSSLKGEFDKFNGSSFSSSYLELGLNIFYILLGWRSCSLSNILYQNRWL